LNPSKPWDHISSFKLQDTNLSLKLVAFWGFFTGMNFLFLRLPAVPMGYREAGKINPGQ